jgi:UDP-2-acetamido-3-amino-2,3-dideoxy-glucuronate N-acetyltransferase
MVRSGTTSSDVRVAVIGCGAWGKNLVRNFAELGALEAIVDHHQPAVEALTARHGGQNLSFEEALASPRIDAVAIVTQPSHHHLLARRALDAGKHVFVEKPLALDMGEARDLAATALRRGLCLMVGHILHYHPAFRALRDVAGEGRLGRLQRIQASRFNLGAVRREEDVLWCLAPHDISMVLALTGHRPTRVAATGGYHLRPEVADTATVQLWFDGGEQAQIAVSWLHPYKEQRLAVIGSEGMAVFDDVEPWERKLVLYPHRVAWNADEAVLARGEGTPIPLEASEPLRSECAHFLDCVRSGARPATDGAEALRVMDVLTRASAAMRAERESYRRPVLAQGGRARVAAAV